ncbi:MAG: RIP metalloprotease RseP [Gammaproteobacteria bacterium]|nr:RIP metalloprotease RseP [Gammaproteobacteria bacterium]
MTLDILNMIWMLAAALAALAILVAVHEYGHFWVAKKLGFYIQEFAIGFGKPIWQYTGRDDIAYKICRWPIGGYVKLLDERNEEVPPELAHRAFNRRPIWQRIAVLVAGPLFNFFLAIFAFWIVFVLGVPALKPIIEPTGADTIAATAGLRSQDQIIKVDDKSVNSINTANITMLESVVKNGEIRLTVVGDNDIERTVNLVTEGNVRRFTKPGALFAELGIDRWVPALPAVIDQVTTGGAADKAGILSGDHILSVDDSEVSGWADLVKKIRGKPGQRMLLTVKRGGELVSVPVMSDSVDAPSGDGSDNTVTVGRIGVTPVIPEGFMSELRVVERYKPLPALAKGVASTWDYSALTLNMLWKMIVGRVSTENLSGPITIVHYAGMTANIGWNAFIHFLAILSLSLGVLNLLPIPILDGGQIVYQLAEGVKGSPLSERAQMIGYQLGVGLLLVLFAVAFYNDIVRLFNW